MDGASPTYDDVVRACRAWIFVPATAQRIETDEYLLLRYPDWYENPLQLFGVLPQRPLDEVIDEALDVARRAFGDAADEILCWARLTAPDGIDEALLARGAVIDERLDVLARTVGPGDAFGAALDGVELRWSDDHATFVDAVRLDTEIFGGTLPTEEQLAPIFEQERAKYAAGGGGSVVAYLDGEAVGAAGVTVALPDARLWGGGVVPRARRRGVYRALLAERLRYSVEHGARLALVKGRVESSAPMLRRTGFATFGQERAYRLALA